MTKHPSGSLYLYPAAWGERAIHGSDRVKTVVLL